MTAEVETAILIAENAARRQRVDEALERNAISVEHVRDPEARLAKDSHNSNKPPFSDGLTRQLPGCAARGAQPPKN